ncbi:MAG TPA: HAD family phosphatase [Verrucomicrobiales bacterium]|nr:HAD family phosphatase [Verrucomicrobiales bacterium]
MYPAFEIPEGEFDGYIFDNDGTLVLSMDLHYAAWVDAYARSGATFEFTRDLAQAMAGKDMVETVEEVNRLFGQRLDPMRVVADQESYYFTHLHLVQRNEPLIRFAEETALRRPVAVASGGRRHIVERTLGAARLGTLFRHVVTMDDVKRGKPAPDLFLVAAERMGVEPRRCLVFEDGVLGMEAAAAAGMEAVLLRYG